jgi:glycosyltransferase involved in cell wall biosynthesis
MIDILLATYNGEKYLRQQLDSIFAQTNQDWQLLIRDDGSVDGTLSIIEDYMSRYPGRVRLISDNKGRLGVCLNFGELLNYSTAEYIMFSDQDDVWLPYKIEITLHTMQCSEKLYPGIPLLVHTDKKVVDSGLNVLAESGWEYFNRSPMRGNDLIGMIVDCPVQGCTILMNRLAKEVCAPIPKEAISHDYWSAILVAKSGRVVYSSVATVLWRRHSNSITPTKRRDAWYLLTRMFVRTDQIKFYRRLRKMVEKSGCGVSWWSVLKKKIASVAASFFHSL